MLNSVRETAKGKKTYAAGAGLIILGLAGGFMGFIPVTEAVKFVLEGLGFIGVKSAIVRGGVK